MANEWQYIPDSVLDDEQRSTMAKQWADTARKDLAQQWVDAQGAPQPPFPVAQPPQRDDWAQPAAPAANPLDLTAGGSEPAASPPLGAAPPPSAAPPAVSDSLPPMSATPTLQAPVAGPANSPVVASRDGGREAFKASFAPYAQYAANILGIDPSIVTSMAISESGGGNIPGNSFFGMKGSPYANGSVNLPTWELVNGQRVNINDNFATFASPKDAIDAWIDFLHKHTPGVFGAKTPEEFAAGLKAGGYMTDTAAHYAATLRGIGATEGGSGTPNFSAATPPVAPGAGASAPPTATASLSQPATNPLQGVADAVGGAVQGATQAVLQIPSSVHDLIREAMTRALKPEEQHRLSEYFRQQATDTSTGSLPNTTSGGLLGSLAAPEANRQQNAADALNAVGWNRPIPATNPAGVTLPTGEQLVPDVITPLTSAPGEFGGAAQQGNALGMAGAVLGVAGDVGGMLPGGGEAKVVAEGAEKLAAGLAGKDVAHGLTINLPKYAPQEVQDIIQQAYDAHPQIMDEARRGVIPDAAIRDLADQASTTVSKVISQWAPGKAGNAETILAMRQALSTEAQKVVAAQQRLQSNPGDMQALSDLTQALTRHVAVQEAVTGVTAEAGRALRQFRQPVTGAEFTLQQIQRLAKQYHVGADELGERLAKVGLSDPKQVAAVAQSLVKFKPTDYLSSLWYFNLLASPLTHVRNIVSNAVTMAVAPLEAPIAAGLDVARVGASRAVGMDVSRQRFFGEGTERVFGLGAGLRDGIPNALQAFMHGTSAAAVDAGKLAGTAAAREPFSGLAGAVINAPGRMLAAEDNFFRALNKTSSLYALAYRQASAEGLKGAELADRIVQLRTEPTLLARAGEEAAYRIFQAPSNFAAWASRGPGWTKFFVPFVRTPVNIAKYTVANSPAGLGTLAWDAARGNLKSAGAVEDRLARVGIGSAIMGGLLAYAQDGNLTGAAPPDQAGRDAFERVHPQYSFKVGDQWRSYQALQPFSSLFAVAASIHDAQQKGLKLEPAAALTMGAFAVAKSLLDMPWTQGLNNALEALHDPQSAGPTYAKTLGRSAAFPSSLMSFLEKATDGMLRDPSGPVEAFVGNYPGIGQSIAPKQNAWGQDVQRPAEQQGLSALNPFQPAPARNDPVEQALDRLQIHGFKAEPGFVGSTVTVPKINQAVELTDTEQRQLQRVSGQMAYAFLLPMVTDPRWASYSPEDQSKLVNAIITKSREYARKQLMPDLVTRGLAAYEAEQASGIKKPAPRP